MRLRFRFTKTGKIRFLGHRDLARCWERAIRRCQLPVAYSEGFSPRPRLHYGLALPTGAESLAEYLDLDLTDEVPLDGLTKALTDALPVGVDVVAVGEVAFNATALQAVVDRCTWRIQLLDAALDEVDAAIGALAARDDVPLTFERKGKAITENVRGAIGAMTTELLADDPTTVTPGGVALTVDLATKPRSLRPSELLACLEPPGHVHRICRTEQWMTIDGRPEPPLWVGAPSVPAAPAP